MSSQISPQDMERHQALPPPSALYPQVLRQPVVMWWLLCMTPLGRGQLMTWSSAGHAISICLAMGRNATPDLGARSLSRPLPQPCLSLYHQVRAVRKEWNPFWKYHEVFKFSPNPLPASSGAAWWLLSAGQPHVSTLVLLQPLVTWLLSKQRFLPGSQCATLTYHHPSLWKEIWLHTEGHKGLHWRQRYLQRTSHCLGKKVNNMNYLVMLYTACILKCKSI